MHTERRTMFPRKSCSGRKRVYSRAAARGDDFREGIPASYETASPSRMVTQPPNL